MSHLSPYGTVEFSSVQEVEWRAGTTVRCTHQVMTWTPPENDSQHLPVGFTIQFDCFTGNDGVRRFIPRNGDWRNLERTCYLAGTAVRISLGKLPVECRTNERLQFLASQYLRSTRIRFKRRFLRPNDIHIRNRGRLEHSADNVMFDLVGLHPAFEEIGQIRKMSQSDRQDFQSQFFNGLYQMALSISDGQAEPSNFHGPKFALLADEAGSHINQEELEEVNERFFNSVDGKLQLELESDEFDFDQWLTSSRTSLPTLLSRKTIQMGLGLSLIHI